jgi:hypothetical protein
MDGPKCMRKCRHEKARGKERNLSLNVGFGKIVQEYVLGGL